MSKKKSLQLNVVNPNAAGIDVGSKEHYVAIGQGPSDVRKFGVYTSDHQSLIKWLKENQIETVAMEATGSYWQTLFSAIQSSGIEVLLTNCKHIRNPEGKTDVKDCSWLQKLHALGLLKGCFLPSEEITKLRCYHRHRSNLLESSSRCLLRMQKSLHLMNIRLEVVLSDISGSSGMKILQAIIDGQRNGEQLAALANKRVKKSREEIIAALQGNWKEELLYQLKDEFEIYHSFLERIARCDKQIELQLESMIENWEKDEIIPELTKKKIQAKQVKVNVSKLSYQYFGVDLMSIDGIANNTVMSFIAEVGKDICKFFCR